MMAHRKYESIPVTKLLIRSDNPRYDPVRGQREALALIAREQAIKLVNLGQHILDRGTDPSDIPIVATADDEDFYIVLEGNRRVAALKLLSTPGLAESLKLPQTLLKRWKALEAEGRDSAPKEITCVIMSREDASEWIGLKHTGENEGVGTVNWDGLATQRYRGGSPALQAIDLIVEKGYLTSEEERKLSRISITNIERVLGTPEARSLLGVDIREGDLVLVAPEEEALGRLAIVICDVLNRTVKVTQLDTKPQRVEYAESVAGKEIPKAHQRDKVSEEEGTAGPEGDKAKPTSKRKSERKTLIPRDLKLAIPQTRINRIYDELQRIQIDKFVNSCAVLLRVFLELSLDDYASQNNVVPASPSKTGSATKQFRDLQLRKKILAVATHMEDNDVCGKAELQGPRSLAESKNTLFSVDSLHAYVHNQHYNPSPTDLKANWDNIQAFMHKIWS